MSAIEKLLSAKEGTEVTLHPRYIVINDGISSEAVDLITKVADPSQVLVFHDHDVPTGSSDSAALYKKLNQFRKKFSLSFFNSKGIGYQYLVDNLLNAGDIVLGAGSHGGIYSSVGALGIDVSKGDLARAIGSGVYTMTVPESISVSLTGTLSKGVTAMDAGFYLRRLLKDKEEFAVEISSPLTKRQNAILASVLSECVKVVCFTECSSPDLHVDLSKVGQLVMLPVESRSDQKIAEIKDAEGLNLYTFKAGQIGGYTAGTIDVLRLVRRQLEGKKLKNGFRLSIVPATSADYLKALSEGIIEFFMDYGAQILPPSDRSTVVQGAGAMGDKEKLLTTGLYTFKGAMGMDTSVVFSASAYLVAQASCQKEV